MARSEDDRIAELEFAIPKIQSALDSLKAVITTNGHSREFPAVPAAGLAASFAAPLTALSPGVAAPSFPAVAAPGLGAVLPFPWWWFPPAPPLNPAAGEAGQLVDEAKILVDELTLDADDVESNDAAVQRFRERVIDLLRRARAAQSKARAAAAAGHAHRAVRADLRAARNSFREADGKIRDSRTAGSNPSAKRKLKEAIDKINDDLEHLQNALDKL